jgi:hypothetical protein
VRCRNLIGGELVGYGGEASARGVAVSDSFGDIGWSRGGTAACGLGLRLRARRPAMLGQ